MICEVALVKAIAAIFWLLAATAYGQTVWTKQDTLPLVKVMNSIAYGGSQFVMVGTPGSVLTSRME